MSKTLLFAGVMATAMTALSLPRYSTTSVVALTGAQILSQQQEQPVKKYKRKDCPVCKGKGWYISGDGIAKVSCGYCEPENKELPADFINPSIIINNE